MLNSYSKEYFINHTYWSVSPALDICPMTTLRLTAAWAGHSAGSFSIYEWGKELILWEVVSVNVITWCYAFTVLSTGEGYCGESWKFSATWLKQWRQQQRLYSILRKLCFLLLDFDFKKDLLTLMSNICGWNEMCFPRISSNILLSSW